MVASNRSGTDDRMTEFHAGSSAIAHDFPASLEAKDMAVIAPLRCETKGTGNERTALGG